MTFLSLLLDIIQSCAAIPRDHHLNVAINCEKVDVQQLDPTVPHLQSPSTAVIAKETPAIQRYTLTSLSEWYKDEPAISVFRAQLECDAGSATSDEAAGTADVVQRNIVVKEDDTPMLIDFNCGVVHECDSRTDRPIVFHAPEPPAGQMGCYEMQQTADEADVWPPTSYLYSTSSDDRIPLEEVLKGRDNIIRFQEERGIDHERAGNNADRVLVKLNNWIDFRTLHDGEVPLIKAPWTPLLT